MARRFVRVDLSDTGRDFRPIAVEPGVPLLDYSNANSKIIFRWLGGLSAEPEWEGESVNFYVREDHGGRVEDVVCQSASDEDLQGLLKADVETLRERLSKAKAETSTERAVYKALNQSLVKLLDDPHRTDRDNYFFRYKDVQGRWRLVWCWGYQRVDQVPAPTLICTDPDCSLLFVRRPGQSAKCPSCEALHVPRVVKRRPRKLGRLVALLLLLLALWACWLLYRNQQLAKLELGIDPMPVLLGQSSKLHVDAVSKAGTKYSVRESSKLSLAVDPPTLARLDGARVEGLSAGKGKLVATFRQAWGKPLVSTLDFEVLPGLADRPVKGAPRRPSNVSIVSDQGPSVAFPKGAEFDDFRVEVSYPDGMKRIVTKKATLHASGDPAEAPVAFRGGRMIGIHPGKTEVTAEFEGVATQRPLAVEVADKVDVDEIRLRPAPLTLLPKDTVTVEAVGYKNKKSVGVIGGLAGVSWKSQNPEIARVQGPELTAQKLGDTQVTAAYGPLASKPLDVHVVNSLADVLIVDPRVLAMHVGESRQLGADLSVSRANVDFSREVQVSSSAPGTVQFQPESRTLKALKEGTATVTFSLGDKLVNTEVTVLPAGALDGTLVVEPAEATLAVGQALPLRAFLIGKDGQRLDLTDVAQWSSPSAPSPPTRHQVELRGNQVCAVVAGQADVTAKLPNGETTAKAHVTVTDDPITELVADPAQLVLSTGETAHLRIEGRAACGTHELFPQDKLSLDAKGANPSSIEITQPQDVHAVAPGSAKVAVRWTDKLKLSLQVPVTVGDNVWTDLALTPSAATIHPNQAFDYQVIGRRGGVVQVVSPDQVKLSASNPDVAHLDGMRVVAGAPGTSEITAQVGGQQLKANLAVVVGEDAPRIVGEPAGGVAVFGPGGFWRDGRWYGGEGVIEGGVVGVPGGVVTDKPIAALFIDPAQTAVRLGQSTPRFHARAQDLAGNQIEVPASLESMNDKVLTPDLAPGHEGQFLAVGQGHTQVRARYADREANAEVTVGGDRFANVDSSVADPTDRDFAVNLDIAAGAGEGPLEYRAYQVGQPPPSGWVASQVQGDAQHTILQSPRLQKGPPSTFYDLMIESRNPADGSVQQYPFRFRVGLTIEKSTETAPPGIPERKPAPADGPETKPAPAESPAMPPTPADDTPFGTEPPQKK
jgi:hypothetical protein